MKKMSFYALTLLIFMSTFGYSQEVAVVEDVKKSVVIEGSEFGLLVNYLEANGNFINSDNAPAIINASEIKENLKNPKYLVLDIRSEAWFEYGQIKNSVNVKGGELLNYFENEINPADFDKITIVCYSGQSAAYYAGLLRLYGFNNVYNMKWGMSSWADEFAETKWVKQSADVSDVSLEATINTSELLETYPAINTGKETDKEILQTRIKELFEIPYNECVAAKDKFYPNLADYFIVDYNSKEQYDVKHIQGAIHFQPNKSLALNESLLKLPTDKKIIIYSNTGQHAAYAMALLKVLGYDVVNLAYGANSFMNSTLKEKGWDAFTVEEINNYPVVE